MAKYMEGVIIIKINIEVEKVSSKFRNTYFHKSQFIR